MDYHNSPENIPKVNNVVNSIDLVFLLYWGVLVLWQNFGSAKTGSNQDTVIKMSLLAIMVVYYLSHRMAFKPIGFLAFFVLAAGIVMAFYREGAFDIRTILYYFFPLLFIFLSLVVGGKYQITKSQLLRFLNIIIGFVLYMALYAIIFKTDSFLGAFSLTSAYGNELSSFLLGGHEYGLYLLAGIASSIICLGLGKNQSSLRRGYYLMCIFLFSVNLCLTFSRTSMLGALCVVVIYVVMDKKSSLRRWLIAAICIAVLLIIFVPTLNSFFFRIVLKENNVAERDVLLEYAINYYQSGNIIDKLWGLGVNSTRSFIGDEAGHSSVHNGYLQILLYFGLSGFIVAIAFVLSRIMASLKAIRKNRFIGMMCLALSVSAAAIMFTNTTVMFFSTTDSFFFTVFMLLVPMYVLNAVNAGTFDD